MSVPQANASTRPRQQQPQRNLNQQQQSSSYDFQPQPTDRTLVMQPEKGGEAAMGWTGRCPVQAAGC